MQMTQLVKTLNKGQVTIPKRMRTKLGITKDSYLRASMKENKLILEPITLTEPTDKYIRTFSDKEIREWLALDKMDSKTRDKAKRLLK